MCTHLCRRGVLPHNGQKPHNEADDHSSIHKIQHEYAHVPCLLAAPRSVAKGLPHSKQQAAGALSEMTTDGSPGIVHGRRRGWRKHTPPRYGEAHATPWRGMQPVAGRWQHPPTACRAARAQPPVTVVSAITGGLRKQRPPCCRPCLAYCRVLQLRACAISGNRRLRACSRMQPQQRWWRRSLSLLAGRQAMRRRNRRHASHIMRCAVAERHAPPIYGRCGSELPVIARIGRDAHRILSIDRD